MVQYPLFFRKKQKISDEHAKNKPCLSTPRGRDFVFFSYSLLIVAIFYDMIRLMRRKPMEMILCLIVFLWQ
ncbi:hypothetical protein SB48_HM08orf05314 [Heyndrickxia coagulans]|uniref:Uncharacterized protein n=1 Tax=Heyndrickxia coagulans TaxID=1398 RepID=A0AAN0T7B7_HEYCO|nr:hypothetical protein SB48_HM08orf05314 [Heyndrickxia coagulans]KYC60367.1 hypothetical protein B4100_0716 [Heyndrickxia coagulans]